MLSRPILLCSSLDSPDLNSFAAVFGGRPDVTNDPI